MEEATAGRALAARANRVRTLPNLISTLRVLLVPGVVALILAPFDGHARWAAVAYAVAAASDSLDGWLARRRGSISTVGVFLDPLADKLLVSGALIALVERGRVGTWVVLVIVAREFAISGLRMLAAGAADVISASQLGKLKTFSQNTMIVALLLAPAEAGWVDALVALAVILTLWSLVDYFWRARAHFRGARG